MSYGFNILVDEIKEKDNDFEIFFALLFIAMIGTLIACPDYFGQWMRRMNTDFVCFANGMKYIEGYVILIPGR